MALLVRGARVVLILVRAHGGALWRLKQLNMLGFCVGAIVTTSVTIELWSHKSPQGDHSVNVLGFLWSRNSFWSFF